MAAKNDKKLLETIYDFMKLMMVLYNEITLSYLPQMLLVQHNVSHVN